MKGLKGPPCPNGDKGKTHKNNEKHARDGGGQRRAVIGRGRGGASSSVCEGGGEVLGLQAQGGVVRVSIAHYNTPDEISRLITQLDAAIDAAIDTMPHLA